MQIVKQMLRSFLAIFIGMLLISIIAEGIEFAIVTAVHGSVTSDPKVYFAVRNQLWILLLKFLYNGIAAFVGGFIAAKIASKAQLAHGIVIAIIQIAAFIWGMTASEFAGTTPVWAWTTLCFIMFPAIVFGTYVAQKK